MKDEMRQRVAMLAPKAAQPEGFDGIVIEAGTYYRDVSSLLREIEILTWDDVDLLHEARTRAPTLGMALKDLAARIESLLPPRDTTQLREGSA